MRRIVVILLLVLAPAALGARRRVVLPIPPLPVAEIDRIGAAHAQLNPGLAIAVRKDGAFHVRGYGLLDREANIPVRSDSVFQIASVTKQFTAAAVMRLVEEGTLSVDDRARNFLPELDSRFDAVTIRHLLNHTSGVRDYEAHLTTPYEPKTQQEIVAFITSGPLYFQPGTEHRYSNSGYYLLGMIIERASSMTYEQFLRETFFEPLALTGTSYCGTTAPPPDGHLIVSGGAATPVRSADMSLLYAAGALCSTAVDLLRWNEALVSGVAVSSESYARMTSESVRMFPGMRYGFGLIVEDLAGSRRIWHNGGILGFSSHLAWFPDQRLTIAVLVNVFDFERDRATAIAGEIAGALR